MRESNLERKGDCDSLLARDAQARIAVVSPWPPCMSLSPSPGPTRLVYAAAVARPVRLVAMLLHLVYQ